MDSSNVAFLTLGIIFYADERQDNAAIDSARENGVLFIIANISYSFNIF